MRYYARFNSNDFIIVELPEISDSSRETKFSDVKIDFDGYDEALLPIQYQEINIVQIDELDVETILMVGYVESVDYPEFEFDDQPFHITIGLLSPYAYAAKRSTSTQINSLPLNTSILTILQPLIDDGFTIEENDLPTKLLSEIFQSETIEKVMNYLAGKFGFIWYIDQNKKIYLRNIDNLANQTPVLEITDTDRKYLKSIKPTKTVVDYANRLNIKNIVLITADTLLPFTTLTNGETYTFKYPFSISRNVAFRLGPITEYSNLSYMFSMYTEESANRYMIEVDPDLRTVTTSDEIGYSGIDDDVPGIKILFTTDPSDPTKITGFKWLGGAETINGLITFSSLQPYQASYIDPVEISTIKGKLNTSGVIEKVVDANLKYYAYDELQDYAVSLFSQNNVATNEITCTFKGLLNDTNFIAVRDLLKITKVFKVTLPNFKIDGSFIITDIDYSIGTQTGEIKISARNYNLNESYLDIYRVPISEDAEDTLTRKLVVFYNQDNRTIITKEMLVNGVRVDV